MPTAKVYFVPVDNGEAPESIAEKALRAADAAGLADVITPHQPCAIKQHFGEGANDGYIKPAVTRSVCDWVRKAGGQPFVTDTNTLYRGRRGQALDHLQMAREHGFSHESLGAPVLIADGLVGVDQVTVPIQGGRHFREVRIAAAGYHAASCIVLTHVKGHCQTGYAGAIKNVGMGFAARAGKLAQHHVGHPTFTKSRCRACGVCMRWCPADAVVMHKTAQVLADKCVGCGECLALCPHGAIGFNWDVEGPALIERICEHVLGFLTTKRGRVGYLNFLIDVTRNCDCVDSRQRQPYPDVGILAGTDIIAIEKATADLSRERYGKDIWLEWWPESNYLAHFEYGAKLGLGTADYVRIQC